jgi:hypothetical protein
LSGDQKSDPAKEPEPTGRTVNVSGRLVLDLPESDHKQEKRKHQQRTFLEKLKKDLFRRLHKGSFLVEIAALIGLFCYARSASIQATANKKAAKTALIAAQTAQKQLELSERPWITAEPLSVGEFTVNERDDASVTVQFTFRNVGHSLAKAIVYTYGIASRELKNPVTEQKDLCLNFREGNAPYAKRVANQSIGFLPFPDEHLEAPLTFEVPMEDADRITKKFGTKLPIMIRPAIFGCIDYQFSFSAGWHRTEFMFGLIRHDPAYPNQSSPLPIGRKTSIPAEQLVLLRDIEGNSAD